MEFKSIQTLKDSEENPRRITKDRRLALKRSIEKYGDLSGIIFNRKTGNLVGGHQRISIFRKADVQIKTYPHTDSTGTLAIGEVVIPTSKTTFLRIPYREVSWNGDREMAANIAANAGGGDFDYDKLKKIITRLTNHKFPIEQDIPFDDLPLRKEIYHFDNSVKPEKGGVKKIRRLDARPSVETVKVKTCTCPRCNFTYRVDDV
jgi:uncharacterized protein YbaR (Trm112 family)